MKTPEELADAVIVDYHDKNWHLSVSCSPLLRNRIAEAIRSAVKDERDKSAVAVLEIGRAMLDRDRVGGSALCDAELARLSNKDRTETPGALS